MGIFVEDFMEGIMGDRELACYHDKFQDPYEMELLKEKLVQFFRFKLDGSRFYIGKSMPDVHRNLGISDEVFTSACEVFEHSLSKVSNLKDINVEFAKRVSGIQDEICFPPIVESEETNESPEAFTVDPLGALFKAMGQ